MNQAPATVQMKVADVSAAMVRPEFADSALMVCPVLGNTATVLTAVVVQTSISSPGTAGGKVTEKAAPALETVTLATLAEISVPLACVPVALAARLAEENLTFKVAAPLANS